MVPAPLDGPALAASLAQERRRFAQLVEASGYQREDA
jgi:hypothetical protein